LGTPPPPPVRIRSRAGGANVEPRTPNPRVHRRPVVRLRGGNGVVGCPILPPCHKIAETVARQRSNLRSMHSIIRSSVNPVILILRIPRGLASPGSEQVKCGWACCASQPSSGDKSAISATSVGDPIGHQDPPLFAKRFYQCVATPRSSGHNLTTGEGEERRNGTRQGEGNRQREKEREMILTRITHSEPIQMNTMTTQNVTGVINPFGPC
jgi:hypothetical protein